MGTQTQNDFCKFGLAVIETEAQAILELTQRINDTFNQACTHLLECAGKIIVMGMGKSGHIAHKIAATLASTGSPAFFVHPGEASHGDMGMVTHSDLILAISHSGETQELLTLLPMLKVLNVPIVSLTGNPNSTLAKASNVHLDVSVAHEACPLGLAPTSSTTATLVMGDALAIALLQAKGFTTKDFARTHPGGRLGRRLLLTVDTLMQKGDTIPKISEQATISEALIEVTEKKLGMTCVVDHETRLSGIFTDGDIRRALQKNIDIHTTPVVEAMTQHCKTIPLGLLAVDALQIMETHKITSLVITNDHRVPIGVLHLHDLLAAGIL